MLTIQSKIRISSHVTTSRVDEDVVLLNTHTNQYFALEDVSARLWILLEGGIGLADICLKLEKEYLVEHVELKRDVLELISHFMENGLVELVEE